MYLCCSLSAGWARQSSCSRWTWWRTGCSWAVRGRRLESIKPASTPCSPSWETRAWGASTPGTSASPHPDFYHFNSRFISLLHCGFLCVFVSLSAGLLRQATYTTTRLGIYTILFEKMTSSDGRPPNFFLKVSWKSERLMSSEII